MFDVTLRFLDEKQIFARHACRESLQLN